MLHTTSTEPRYGAPYTAGITTGPVRATVAASRTVAMSTARPMRSAAAWPTAPDVTRGKITSATAVGNSMTPSATGRATAYSATAVVPASAWTTGTSIRSMPY